MRGGHLPEDRALLYRLCVEGLLHHWDQRRGIRSEFSLEEKLRTCREVALAMQADDRAEYEAEKVEEIFAAVLGDAERARRLLEHVRYRTGLLLERRARVSAFAHLTFQEYLAARAVYEGNRRGVDAGQLVREHDDGRWQDVIPLYCGVAPAPVAREVIEALVGHADTKSLSTVLTEAYFSAGPEVLQDGALRQRVLERIAIAPATWKVKNLARFRADEAGGVANLCVGKIKSDLSTSEACDFLCGHPELMDEAMVIERLQGWQSMSPAQLSEVVYLLHAHGSDATLTELARHGQIYGAEAVFLGLRWGCQAEVAFLGLVDWKERGYEEGRTGYQAALLGVLRALVEATHFVEGTFAEDVFSEEMAEMLLTGWLPGDDGSRSGFVGVARELAARMERTHESGWTNEVVAALRAWADFVERAISEKAEGPQGRG